MATAYDNRTDLPETRECYAFTFLLGKRGGITEDVANAVYGKCSDATLCIRAENAYLAFDREADDLEGAIASAFRDAHDLGLEIVRVIPPGEETIEVINDLIRASRVLATGFRESGELAAGQDHVGGVSSELLQLLAGDLQKLRQVLRILQP